MGQTVHSQLSNKLKSDSYNSADDTLSKVIDIITYLNEYATKTLLGKEVRKIYLIGSDVNSIQPFLLAVAKTLFNTHKYNTIS